MLAAYQHAADQCPGLAWSVLAAIGKVESDHGRIGGSQPGPDGIIAPRIIGVALDGLGPVALIRDTDGGVLDGDVVYDRAVGPMQFIPSTWASMGVDGDGDGIANPHDADDAIPAAAGLLCDGGAAQRGRLRQAIYSYNHSWDYVDRVLDWADRYATATPAGPGDPVLVDTVLSHPRISIYEGGRDDITARRIDNRILAIMARAADRWTISVTSLQTGHSKCVGGGNYPGCTVSNHWYGRGMDIFTVNGTPVTDTNRDAYTLTLWLSTLPPDLRPNEVGTPWAHLEDRPGHFHDAAHRDHLHLAHEH
ncbi:lytic transglycosylase domain-containing protein [Nitriliruptoria bacterium AS10]|nr:lytic transglycosylase domain-containing protein [Salsipaludibacter albus]